MKKLNLNAIRIDGGTQSRVEINNEIVADYAEAIAAGVEFPPVVVFHDGVDHWLADGFHRFHAHRRAEKASIAADVRAGTVRDAILFSLGANAAHGLHRSNADKRKAVQTMLADMEWVAWSDRKIADACGVSVPFVGAIRRPEVAAKQQERRAKQYPTKAEGCNPITPHAPAPAREKAGITDIGAPAAAKPAPALSATDEPPANDDGMDPLAELERAHSEIEKLTAEIEAAEADDLKAEAIKWRRSYEHAQRQQSEAMDRAKAATDREGWTMKQLRRCGKAVGEDDPKKIAAAVEAMVREVRKAA